MKTKKTLRIVFLCTFMLLFVWAYAQARITNHTCSDCHTMHFSQNGSSMRLGNGQFIEHGEGECADCHSDTRAVLLRLDCLGCHASNPSGGSNIINSNWPQIAHNAATDLAGGNYRYVFADDTYGHNVHGFGSAIPDDNWLGNDPPGYDTNYDPSTSGGYDPGQDAGQIMCAGQNGCHGNRDTSVPYLAMRGTHHANDSMLKFGTIAEAQQGSTSGTSYRFLYNIHGGEDSDWQATVSATDHNEYKGQTYASRPLAGGQTWGATLQTLSQFCAECHGYFHASDEINNQAPPTGSPWKRHPTDVSLPASGEYSAYTAYSTEAPVARTTIPTNPSGTVTPAGSTDDIVMCLSCHKAHASEYGDILRWDYSNMIAGGSGSGGCFTCHTTKNTSP